jgi:hypothetical protein
MTELSIGGRPVPSISLPPCTTSIFSAMSSFPPSSQSAAFSESGFSCRHGGQAMHQSLSAKYLINRFNVNVEHPSFPSSLAIAERMCYVAAV